MKESSKLKKHRRKYKRLLNRAKKKERRILKTGTVVDEILILLKENVENQCIPRMEERHVDSARYYPKVQNFSWILVVLLLKIVMRHWKLSYWFPSLFPTHQQSRIESSQHFYNDLYQSFYHYFFGEKSQVGIHSKEMEEVPLLSPFISLEFIPNRD